MHKEWQPLFFPAAQFLLQNWCHYRISSWCSRTKEMSMTQLALPEQSLSRFNLIIAPTLTLSHKSTAAGDCCGCRLLCMLGNNSHGPLTRPESLGATKNFHYCCLGIPDRWYNFFSVLLSFFCSYFLIALLTSFIPAFLSLSSVCMGCSKMH